VNKSLILSHRYRYLTLSLSTLLFIVVILVILYYNIAFIRRDTVSTNNPSPDSHARISAFVKELSVNDNKSKNNDVAYIQASALQLSSAGIKTDNTKTTLLQQPSKNTNQRVSLPIINNRNIHNYTHTVTESSIQNTKAFSPSQQSSIGKPILRDNLARGVALRSLPVNNITSNTRTNSHSVIVPTMSKMTNTSSNNSSSIAHKTAINTHLPPINENSAKIYYELSKISIKKSRPQQQQQEQELNTKTSSDSDFVREGIIITANAGLDQKVKEGKKVTLSGAGSSSNTNQLSFFWNQISGKSVKLHYIDTAKAKFKAPHVKKSTNLGFQLTVYDGNGYSSSDTLKVIVKSHKHNHSHKHKH
jgi:K319L-like, PKD domain